jgi:hypothetical protein
MAISGLDHLLHDYVDLYLMPDLATMAAAPVPESGRGGMRFPLAQTVMAGIELLGRLELGKGKGAGFQCYWRRHLASVADVYATPGLDDLFYQLVRHGIAHTTLAKGSDVRLVMHRIDLHLRVWDGSLYVDCAQLAADFRLSYKQSFLPRLEDAFVRQAAEENAGRFIDEVVQAAARYGAATIAKMPPMAGPPMWPADSAMPADSYVSVGATGPAAPAGPGASYQSTGATGPVDPAEPFDIDR